jgi:hypothetical protein
MRIKRRAGTTNMVVVRWVERLERHREDGANVIVRRMHSVARGPSSPHLLDKPAAGAPEPKKLSRTELADQTAVAEMAARQVTDRRSSRGSRKGFGGWVRSCGISFPFVGGPGLGIDGDHIRRYSGDAGEPGDEAPLECRRVKRCEGVVQLVVRRGSILERQEPPRKIDPPGLSVRC